MTAAKFLTFTVVSLFLTTVVKVFFVTTLNIDSLYVVYVMWFVLALINIACIRRVGVINYIESVFVLLVWVFGSMFLDLLILSGIKGTEIYRELYLWGSYLIVALVVFIFHKKRHVEIRHIQRAAAPPPKAHH